MSSDLNPDQRLALAEMFALLGDPTRLGIVLRCRHQRRSVSEIADASDLSRSLVSHHLRLLRTAALLKVEREGRYAYYSVADAHVEHMLDDMVGHVRHTNGAHTLGSRRRSETTATGTLSMSQDCHSHPDHDHQHGPDCGHQAVRHDDHIDYLHDGHLHHPHEVDGLVHYDEHVIAISETNPDGCDHRLTACHASGHVHGPGCGHEAVPHGDHVDYIVDGRLHHPHGDHCDDHGPVTLVESR